jgi:ABC-type uncharacterized transport system auxiliary subunit
MTRKLLALLAAVVLTTTFALAGCSQTEAPADEFVLEDELMTEDAMVEETMEEEVAEEAMEEEVVEEAMEEEAAE